MKESTIFGIPWMLQRKAILAPIQIEINNKQPCINLPRSSLVSVYFYIDVLTHHMRKDNCKFSTDNLCKYFNENRMKCKTYKCDTFCMIQRVKWTTNGSEKKNKITKFYFANLFLSDVWVIELRGEIFFKLSLLDSQFFDHLGI